MADAQPTIQKAAALLKAGHRNKAQRILVKYLQANVESEAGWLLLSQAVSDPAKQRECLGYVLAINPKNEQAGRMLAELNDTPGVESPVPADTAPPEPAGRQDTAIEAVERLRGNIGRLQLGKQKQRKVLWESISALVTIAGVAAVLAWLKLYALLPLLGLCFLGMLAVLVLVLIRRREFDREIAGQQQELAMRETLLRQR